MKNLNLEGMQQINGSGFWHQVVACDIVFGVMLGAFNPILGFAGSLACNYASYKGWIGESAYAPEELQKTF